ncbi:MAG: hypothetical protein C4345_12745, partial [Chloroflexota bacterium]
VSAVKLGLLPSVGAASFSHPGKHLQHLILPALALGLIETASIARMTRSVMIGILSDDFVQTARAKGLTEQTVLIRHGLRAGLNAGGVRRAGSDRRCWSSWLRTHRRGCGAGSR